MKKALQQSQVTLKGAKGGWNRLKAKARKAAKKAKADLAEELKEAKEAEQGGPYGQHTIITAHDILNVPSKIDTVDHLRPFMKELHNIFVLNRGKWEIGSQNEFLEAGTQLIDQIAMMKKIKMKDVWGGMQEHQLDLIINISGSVDEDRDEMVVINYLIEFDEPVKREVYGAGKEELTLLRVKVKPPMLNLLTKYDFKKD